mmetsp:Transcript_11451/g.14147  ORF Transcript_11451/g.14147 Transcript_11451/m.14147 type:complete len:374 (-) Transcript_11451:73-1194(-)
MQRNSVITFSGVGSKRKRTTNKSSNSKRAKVEQTKQIPLGYPRASASTTIPVLKAELKHRGAKGYSQKPKAALLDLVGNNSILLHLTAEYKAYQALLQQVEQEKLQAVEQQEQKRIREEEDKENQRKQEILALQALREQEIVEQRSKHIKKTKVHPCPLASSAELLFEGEPRPSLFSARCSDNSPFCSHTVCWTCESCNFDICAACFAFQSLPAKQQEQKLKRREAEQQQRRKKELQRAQQMRAAEEARIQKEKAKYPPQVQNPEARHKNKNKMLKFVIAETEGYYPDAFHSYQSPSITFDSSYSSLQDANLRAEYKYLYENQWGLSRDEMVERGYDKKMTNGKVKFIFHGEEIYVVQVCTAEGFKEMSTKDY